MDNKQVLEAIKNMNPHDKEMFLLTHRVGKLENGEIQEGNVFDTINNRLDNYEQRLETQENATGAYKDLKQSMAWMHKKIEGHDNHLDSLLFPKRSWLDKLFNK